MALEERLDVGGGRPEFGALGFDLIERSLHELLGDSFAAQLLGNEGVLKVVDVARLHIFNHRFLAVHGDVELPRGFVVVHFQAHRALLSAPRAARRSPASRSAAAWGGIPSARASRSTA